MLSCDPLNGGPFLYARNIVINVLRSESLKIKSGTTQGLFCYNNTIVATTNDEDPGALNATPPASNTGIWWMISGPLIEFGFRNNILVYRGPATRTFFHSRSYTTVDWDHNAWYPDQSITWSNGSFANLSALQATASARTPIFSSISDTSDPATNDVIVTRPFRDECRTWN